MSITRPVRLVLASALCCVAVSWATLAVQASDNAAKLTIGALTHPNENRRWSLAETEAARRYAISCHDRDCEGDLIEITVLPDAADRCDDDFLANRALIAQADGDAVDFSTIERPGFVIRFALVELGCRNWTGSPVFACTRIDGELYGFTAYAGGCRETPPRFDEPVLEFLNGLALDKR